MFKAATCPCAAPETRDHLENALRDRSCSKLPARLPVPAHGLLGSCACYPAYSRTPEVAYFGPTETASDTVSPTVQVACPADLLRAAYSGLHVYSARLQVVDAPSRVSTAPFERRWRSTKTGSAISPVSSRPAYGHLHCFDALHAQKAAPFFLVLHLQALDPSHAPVFLCPIRPLDRLRLSCAGRDELAGGDRSGLDARLLFQPGRLLQQAQVSACHSLLERI
jgi:hypothetical protein